MFYNGVKETPEQWDIKYILRMHQNGYFLGQIAQRADKTQAEVQALIEREKSAFVSL